MTCSGPQTYSKTIDFMAAPRRDPQLLLRRQCRGTTEHHRLEQLPDLAIEVAHPASVAAVRAAAADDGRFDSRDDPCRPGLARSGTVWVGGGALEGPVRPEQLGRQDLIDPPGEQVLLGDHHARLGALAEDAGLLGHGLKVAPGAVRFSLWISRGRLVLRLWIIGTRP
jgi:hypothetical protein